MSATIGLFHATQNAVRPVEEAWYRCGTPVALRHYVDEGLLLLATARGNDDLSVRSRLRHWLTVIADDGADAIMATCSSLTPAVIALRPDLGRPVVAIDEAMVDDAVSRGSRIGVVATLQSAAETTRGLLEMSASSAGRLIGIRTAVAAGAFAALNRGDPAAHDHAVIESAAQIAADVEVIVFAQVSMSRVAIPADRVRVPVLTSAPGAIRRILSMLARPVPAAR